MKDDPKTTCPECRGVIKRLLYPVGIVFKGSGWYINDSRKPEKTEGSETKSDDTRSSETKTGDPKTESTSDATNTPKEPATKS
jgi:predicted nucleic acid-binding Zn ribbon protein